MNLRHLAGVALAAAMVAVPFSLRVAGSLAGICLVCALVREYRVSRAARRAKLPGATEHSNERVGHLR